MLHGTRRLKWHAYFSGRQGIFTPAFSSGRNDGAARNIARRSKWRAVIGISRTVSARGRAIGKRKSSFSRSLNCSVVDGPVCLLRARNSGIGWRIKTFFGWLATQRNSFGPNMVLSIPARKPNAKPASWASATSSATSTSSARMKRSKRCAAFSSNCRTRMGRSRELLFIRGAHRAASRQRMRWAGRRRCGPTFMSSSTRGIR